MQTHPNLTIRRVPWSNPVGRDLRAAQEVELDARRGTAGPSGSDRLGTADPGGPDAAADLAIFLVAYERATGQPLGCGGLRWVSRTTAEVRRVYVLPYARGAGMAGSILTALEAEAHDAGVTLVLAEAGTAASDGRMFFEAAGYRRIPNFGPYQELEDSICYCKPVMNPIRIHIASA